MTIEEMLAQSGILTLMGVGIVLSFIAVLIIAVTVMGKVIHAMGLDVDAVDATKPAVGRGPALASQATIVAVIGAAVSQYQKESK